MKSILNSIKNHQQKDEILKQIRYGQLRQKNLRPFFRGFIELLDNEYGIFSLSNSSINPLKNGRKYF